MSRPKGSKNKVSPDGTRPIDYKIKYSEKIRTEILRAICDGISADQLYKEQPKRYPPAAIVARWVETDPTFNLQMQEARRIYTHRLVEQLHYHRTHPPLKEDHKKTIQNKEGDWFEVFDDKSYKFTYDIWTKQLKSIHDELKELGSIYNKSYVKTTNIKQDTLTEQKVVIIDYKDYHTPKDPKDTQEDQDPKNPLH